MQFKELVLEPFSLLQKQSANLKKTLIVLDGLDEIDDKVAQSDLIRLIAETLHTSHTSPFIWLLCSRPEPHLHDTFRHYETRVLYQSIITSLEDDDGHQDIERFFLEELHGIKEKHSNRFASGTNQLGETDEFLSHIKSSPFLYASTLIRLVGGSNMTDQACQLEDIVDLAERPPLLSHSGRKYAQVDMLYLHILQMIPPDDEIVALRLLGALTVSTLIPAIYLAAMLGIPKVTFYSSLRPLYPVLLVPHEFQYEAEAIRFYHVSFPDFLINPDFSGRFFQDPNLSRTRLAEAQLRAIDNAVVLHSYTSQWLPRDPIMQAYAVTATSYYDVLIHAAKTTWDVCSQISQPSRQWLLKALLNFNFQCLQDVSEAIPTYSFMLFLWWLRESVEEIWELRDIVRTSPTSDIDRDFVRACEQSHRSRPRKPIVSPFPWDRDDMDQILKEPRYVLAGMGKKTVLILLTSETVMVFLTRDINDL
ncbi:hypothetical protein Agabi119p4_7913 [Agaricus bisporus var. burnettii]|uniref:NACHT domain-containing protein n=1 Tax=Agaricus bisporus var. burnettii TaxID=192524 RepID=A0A8H7C967_AGABI|nr:hypothetical protein Agabi119p4_7913 [Agaricus bisporus var. burnettii]